MSAIRKLWCCGQLPIKDAVYFATGESYSAKLPPKGSKRLIIEGKFDLELLLSADPTYVTNIDVTTKQKIDGSNGHLICGEGSYGSEGFFGHLFDDEELDWIAYFENSNPFVEITCDDRHALFRSTSGLLVEIEIENFLR